MTKQAQVLNHLQKSSITPLDALRKYGSFRLAALIYNLKQEGHNIITKNVNVGTKKKPTYVAQYHLIKSK
jgi:hypothetical protein